MSETLQRYGIALGLGAFVTLILFYIMQAVIATDEARLDADFHLSIIEASHNVIMLHMMRSMYELLRNGVFYNRQKMFQQRTTRFELLAQHEVINHAIQRRDPAAARQAVEAHLDYVAKSQKNQRNSDKNEKIAKQRFEHEKLRR